MMLSVKKFLLVLSALIAVACGQLKKEEADSAPALENDAELLDAKKFASKSGTLHLIPDGDMSIDGLVNYTIYENGLLVYKGFVTYRPYRWFEKTEVFEGRYKADSRTFLSSTYSEVGKEHSDFKLMMNVSEERGDLNVVDVKVRERSDVDGRFEIDTSDKLIDIHYAEVTGRAFDSDVVIRVRK